MEYWKGKLLDFWNGSATFQDKIVDDLIREILPEHIRSMIISYDVIVEYKEPAASETDDKTVEQDDNSNLRDDESVDPSLQGLSQPDAKETLG